MQREAAAMDTFQAFFSYAHVEARASPRLVEELTRDLEDVVSASLLNATFSIWKDTNKICTGDRWDSKIEAAVRGCDLLIVLFTPGWIASEYCRKEYLTFEEVEAGLGGGTYIVPVLVRPLGTQERLLTPEQRAVYDSINERQYFPALAPDFLALDENRRRGTLERIAEDIVGIIERRRDLPPEISASAKRGIRARTVTKPSHVRSAQDFEKVDFLTGDYVGIDPKREGQRRGVYAQLDFAERLVVRSDSGATAIFGVGQAYLTIANQGPGQLAQSDELRVPGKDQNSFFVRLIDAPEAITVCIDPVPGKTVLGELALPPAAQENRYSLVATASATVDIENVTAELRVSLDTLALQLPEGKKITPAKRSQIKGLILEAARRQRYQVSEKGEIHRKLRVEERER
jgi:hypothetical protein